MGDITAYRTPPATAVATPKTGYLNALPFYRAAVPRVAKPVGGVTARLSASRFANFSQKTTACLVPNFYSGLYNRIIVTPNLLHLGSISSEQQFKVQVWNAFRHKMTLAAVRLENGEGIEVIGDTAPLGFNGLAVKQWTVKINADGPAEIDATVRWQFGTAAATLRITGSRSTDWAFFPDWSSEVVETLEFLTTVHRSQTGAEQRVANRLSPRRRFEFKVSADGSARRQLENALYGYGSRVWSMPLFTRRTELRQAAQAGQTAIFCDTDGFEFEAGGRLLLTDGSRKETVEIGGVTADEIELKRALLGSFGEGAAVYPLRAARLTDMPQLNRLSDEAVSAQVRLQLHQHNAHSADSGYLPSYRNHPVLEPGGDWAEEVTAQYTRMLQALDNRSGLPYYLDTAQKAFAVFSHRFIADGIAAQSRLRALFYALRGRQRAIWVASGSTDFRLAADINGKQIEVDFAGYTAALLKQTGRQDIRIECGDGTVYYRRIVSAIVLDNGNERLTLDGEGLKLAREQVAKISYLTLSRLESDTVTIQHHTDRLATVSVNFYGVRDELEG